MSDLIPGKRKVIVIGHKNPDTDSICSAIAYAYLKNQTDNRGYEPGRAGDVNPETAYVLQRFGHATPRLFEDVSAQVQDVDIRQVSGVSGNMTTHDALLRMQEEDITTLPIVDESGHLTGLVSVNDLAVAYMNNMDDVTLAKSETTIANIVNTLKGTIVTSHDPQQVFKGKVAVGVSSPEIMESVASPGDLVITANRYETQLCAIEMDAACMVICSSSTVAKTIVELAEKHGTTIISTPYDAFMAACLINQSVPIRYYMSSAEPLCFKLTDSVERASEVMGKTRHVYFPSLDRDGVYCGMISRRNMMNLKHKNLILVDHNEKGQCVDGYDNANILEIIDHHRISSVETMSPVYFRNQPVGCTGTIIYQMYQEQQVELPANIAGILCAAILSDTLLFRSPTCTPMDVAAAKALAAIAGVECEELANSMFEAGENIDGKTPEEVFQTDYKMFQQGGVSFGVGQSSFVTAKNLELARNVLTPYLAQAREKQKVDMVFYLLTDIKNNSSELLFFGEGAEALMKDAFHVEARDGHYIVDGLFSRKKQFLPALLSVMKEQ